MSNRRRAVATASSIALTTFASAAALAAPKVVTTIPPVHSLVTGVMAGVGKPAQLIPGGASPHAYAMRPSEAQMLSEADVVFWVGESLETFLANALPSMARNATIVELTDVPGITLLPVREGGVFDDHDLGADGGDHAHEAAAADDDDHHDEAAAVNDHGHDAEHADVHGHDHGVFDAHIWLSIENTEHIVDAVVAALTVHDPANASAYTKNGEAVHGRLHGLEEALAAYLAPVRERPYVVFHDAYQYLEKEHALRIVGAITVDPEQRPGARRLAELRDRVIDLTAVCIFSEPQFPSDLVETIAEGTQAKTAVLDPLGATLEPGADLYFELMEKMGASLSGCLAETG